MRNPKRKMMTSGPTMMTMMRAALTKKLRKKKTNCKKPECFKGLNRGLFLSGFPIFFLSCIP